MSIFSCITFESTFMKFIHRKTYLDQGVMTKCSLSLFLLSSCVSQESEPLVNYRDTDVLWSDCPAYTCQIPNVTNSGLSTDVYDGTWEGDPLPGLPRVSTPGPVKRWPTGEGMDYLDEETAAATHGDRKSVV